MSDDVAPIDEDVDVAVLRGCKQLRRKAICFRLPPQVVFARHQYWLPYPQLHIPHSRIPPSPSTCTNTHRLILIHRATLHYAFAHDPTVRTSEQRGTLRTLRLTDRHTPQLAILVCEGRATVSVSRSARKPTCFRCAREVGQRPWPAVLPGQFPLARIAHPIKRYPTRYYKRRHGVHVDKGERIVAMAGRPFGICSCWLGTQRLGDPTSTFTPSTIPCRS